MKLSSLLDDPVSLTPPSLLSLFSLLVTSFESNLVFLDTEFGSHEKSCPVVDNIQCLLFASPPEEMFVFGSLLVLETVLKPVTVCLTPKDKMREQKFESRKLPLRRRWWWWQKREEVRTRELFNIHSCIICQSFLSVSLLYSHWSCLRYRDQENESQERKGIERKRRQRQKKTNAFKSRNASENEGQEETWSRDCLLTRQWTETFCRGDGFEGERVRVVVVGVKGEEIEKTEGKKSCHWLKCRVLPWSPLFSLPVNILSQSKWRETEDSSLCPRLISVTLTSLTMEGMKDLCERNKGKKKRSREEEKREGHKWMKGWFGCGFHPTKLPVCFLLISISKYVLSWQRKKRRQNFKTFEKKAKIYLNLSMKGKEWEEEEEG